MRPGLRRYAEVLHYARRNLASGAGVYPVYASFKITLRCHLSCPFCDIPQGSRVADARTEAVIRMIDALACSSTLILCFEGGEPFLREDIEEVLAHAARKPLYVSVVTSYPEICEERRPRVSRYVDFLQISVDEGHHNLGLLERLGEIKAGWQGRVGVQTVVARDGLPTMEDKVAAVRRAGCKIVLMPAVNLDGARHDAPQREDFVRRVRSLRSRYPRTIATSRLFLERYGSGGPCSTASIVIDPDGSVFYPCRLLGLKPFNLLDGSLDSFLLSRRAHELREIARRCERHCGWYQYFAVSLNTMRDFPWDLHAALERIR